MKERLELLRRDTAIDTKHLSAIATVLKKNENFKSEEFESMNNIEPVTIRKPKPKMI